MGQSTERHNCLRTSPQCIHALLNLTFLNQFIYLGIYLIALNKQIIQTLSKSYQFFVASVSAAPPNLVYVDVWKGSSHDYCCLIADDFIPTQSCWFLVVCLLS